MSIRRTRRKPFWIRWSEPWKDIDPFLFWIPVLLTLLGGLLIRSTELHQGWTDWTQHWVVGIVGVAIALFIALQDYKVLLQFHWVVYGITCLSLLAVRFVGTSELGAQRWIPILGFNVQPSEFAKVGFIICLAAILHRYPITNLASIVRPLLVTALPWVLVFIQPDLGTSLVFGVITLGMLYWANAPGGWVILLLSPLVSAIVLNLPLPTVASTTLWILWAIAMGAVAGLTLPRPPLSALLAVVINLVSGAMGHVFWGLLQDYQRDRLTLFLDPDKDPLGGGYHLIQSRIAIGAGQLWGRGLNQGTQTQLNFIPEQHTDFIFSAIGEEFGLIGSLLLLLVFWILCFRLIRTAHQASDNFGSLICIGILAMLIFQIVVNIGMTIGLAPVTGIPLPWLSYGRSAMLTNFLAIGLAEAVARQSKPKINPYANPRRYS